MRNNSTDLSGIINIYKEKGYTSHDVVNIVRNTLGRIKTGHTGTLDPYAQGVLPICIGKATKLADYIASDIKEYKTEITLGITTDTEDITGSIISQNAVTDDDDLILKAIMSFKGEYMQTPPMYSAIKINGKRLYELAREGKEIERKSRLIHIYDISDITKLDNNKYSFTVLCSKGTYIRSLCRDIGIKLGCGGCMSQLIRTRTGSFYIKDSIKIDAFKTIAQEGGINDILLTADKVLDYERVTVSSEANKYLYNGNKINLSYVNGNITGSKALVYDSCNNIIGIYEAAGNFIKPVTMLR